MLGIAAPESGTDSGADDENENRFLEKQASPDEELPNDEEKGMPEIPTHPRRHHSLERHSPGLFVTPIPEEPPLKPPTQRVVAKIESRQSPDLEIIEPWDATLEAQMKWMLQDTLRESAPGSEVVKTEKTDDYAFHEVARKDKRNTSRRHMNGLAPGDNDGEDFQPDSGNDSAVPKQKQSKKRANKSRPKEPNVRKSNSGRSSNAKKSANQNAPKTKSAKVQDLTNRKSHLEIIQNLRPLADAEREELERLELQLAYTILEVETDETDSEGDSTSESEDASRHTDKGKGAKDKEASKSKKSNSSRYRTRAKNAREYFQRRTEKEQEKLAKEMVKERARKRKRGAAPTWAEYKRKKARLARKGKKVVEEERARNFGKFINKVVSHDPVKERAAQGDLPEEEEITAKTHARQMAALREKMMLKILENAPEGYDLRHAKGQRKDLTSALSAWGYKQVEAINGLWQVKGMKVALYNYQLTAAAWMLGRELDNHSLKGGVLADAMGMGKTVVTLACIWGNRPHRNLLKWGEGTTLVVCPSSGIISQWMKEVDTKLGPPFSKRLIHYHASSYRKEILTSANIVWVMSSRSCVLGSRFLTLF
jgi:SNF2 family DNA or RNA helicase